MDGYGFFFGNFGRILHIAWIPGLLMVLAGVFIMEFAPAGDVNTMAEAEARTFVFDTIKIMLAGSLFELLMTLIAVVGLYRLALYGYSPRGIGYLKIGLDDFRVAGAWLLVVSALYITFMALAYLAVLFLAGYIGLSDMAAALPAAGSAGLITSVVGFLDLYRFNLFGAFALIAFIAYMWIYGRLYLAMPAALDQKKASITNVWRLTRHNRFRMMAYLLLLFISLVVFTVLLWLLYYAAIYVASAINVNVLNGEAIDALKILTQDPTQIIKDLSTMSKVIIILAVQIVYFLVSMLGWSIIVGSATGAYKDIAHD